MKLVSGQNAAFVLQQSTDSIVHDVATNVRINGAERIVHKHDISVEVDGSGDVHALLLATRNSNATLANLSCVSHRKHV
jgi:hypothetical protein